MPSLTRIKLQTQLILSTKEAEVTRHEIVSLMRLAHDEPDENLKI